MCDGGSVSFGEKIQPTSPGMSNDFRQTPHASPVLGETVLSLGQMAKSKRGQVGRLSTAFVCS